MVEFADGIKYHIKHFIILYGKQRVDFNGNLTGNLTNN